VFRSRIAMHDQLSKYSQKLIRNRTAEPESIHFYRLDDVVIANTKDEWLDVFTAVFNELNITALLFARASLPFADLLVERADPGSSKLVPKDSETKLFLHDIPFIREQEWIGRPKNDLAFMIANCLKNRKALILQHLGIVAAGGVTVEQAYIAFSSVFHTTFVKYLLDVLIEGFRLPAEQRLFEAFRASWLEIPDLHDLTFASDVLREPAAVMREMCTVGRYTVEKGYVDSFFGNISYFDGTTIFISQTASSLDELEGYIDPVPLDNSTTAGLSASSELPAHRGIYLSSAYHAVLHGHPKFSVIMSMFCRESNCMTEDCNRFCNRKRSVGAIPIVAGETGAGGLAKSVPASIKDSGVCIAYGHGIFSAGKTGFREAFMKMAEAEDLCRESYFELVRHMIESCKSRR